VVRSREAWLKHQEPPLWGTKSSQPSQLPSFKEESMRIPRSNKHKYSLEWFLGHQKVARNNWEVAPRSSTPASATAYIEGQKGKRRHLLTTNLVKQCGKKTPSISRTTPKTLDTTRPKRWPTFVTPADSAIGWTRKPWHSCDWRTRWTERLPGEETNVQPGVGPGCGWLLRTKVKQRACL